MESIIDAIVRFVTVYRSFEFVFEHIAKMVEFFLKKNFTKKD